MGRAQQIKALKIAKTLSARLIGVKRMESFMRGINSRREYAQILKARSEHLVKIDQPLILITQIQRSGGTLLSQLFDAHPQCLAHPYELYIGFPDKSTWPRFDLASSPEDWYSILHEKPAIRSFWKGYRKYSKAGEEVVGSELRTFPFLLPPMLQKDIFMYCTKNNVFEYERDIFNCYMTSYFNGWLDNHNLYGQQHKYITAFVPRMGMASNNISRMFEVYPDGKMISIVRDPRSWFASARKHQPGIYGDIKEAIGLWRLSTRSALQARREHGKQVYIMMFEQLVEATEKCMTVLAEYLDLKFAPTLLQPTFNGMPIKADSSFKVQEHGIIAATVDRYKSLLGKQEIQYIDSEAYPLYEEAMLAA